MSKQVKVGNVTLGAGAPVRIQSMLSARWDDFDKAVSQAKELEQAGCEIVRIAIPTLKSAQIIPILKNSISIPLVADIHFDYRLALKAVELGIDKVRINPGNIGDIENVKKVAQACRKKGVPIRIGVNSGSLQKEVLEKYISPTPEALVESAAIHASFLERFDFDDIVISIKSSSPVNTIKAYRLAHERFDYPLHLGVTEAGTERMGIIKSAIGIGGLLADGIGDTIRVSLTGDPVKEIYAAKDILKALGKKGYGPNLICCPTCGRTSIDLISLAENVEKRLNTYTKDITVAVMGCVVNGPGEAKEADIGLAGGAGKGIIFKKDKILGTYPENELIDRLFSEIDKL